jgi:exopolyphosphatase/guanosine-5'-triphosphate,3'-diphosphate pyrophosphatase
MMNIEEYLDETMLSVVVKKYNINNIDIHQLKVADFSMKLFYCLKEYSNLNDSEKNLLRYSALLHDIGYFIGKEKHHKHTKYIIMRDPIFDVIPYNLRLFLSLITSSHGKSIDKGIDFYPFEIKLMLLKLISILRIADALDHTHILSICLNKLHIEKHTLNLEINGVKVTNIVKKVEKKCILFTKTFNMPVAINLNFNGIKKP